jgi:hypothetical protein
MDSYRLRITKKKEFFGSALARHGYDAIAMAKRQVDYLAEK